MSLFGNLGGMLRDLLDQYGGPEAVAGQVFTQLGGVQGILNKLQQAGFGSQVSSWLGSGSNQPIDSGSITEALGRGPLADIAAKIGITPEQLSETLSHTLPGIVDKLSPNGHLQPHMADGGSADGMSP